MRLVQACAVAAIVLMAGGPARAQHASRPLVDMARAKVVDLTYAFDEHTLYWPTSPSRFQLTELHKGPTDAGFFYAANSFCTPEHGGTHIDTPIHFAEGRRTLDRVPWSNSWARRW